MARRICVDPVEVQKAKQLRDQATTVSEYRKALSVILAVEYGSNADRTAEVLGTSRHNVFRDRNDIRKSRRHIKKNVGWSSKFFNDH